MNASLQALGDRVGATEKFVKFGDGSFCRSFILAQDLVTKILEQRLRAFGQLFWAIFWGDWRHKPQNHSSNRGMHSRTENCGPETNPYNRIDGERSPAYGQSY